MAVEGTTTTTARYDVEKQVKPEVNWGIGLEAENVAGRIAGLEEWWSCQKED